jgi:hypothetical protein
MNLNTNRVMKSRKHNDTICRECRQHIIGISISGATTINLRYREILPDNREVIFICGFKPEEKFFYPYKPTE